MSEPQATSPRLVIGTAGHIDHGKTSLIRALTGIDTDRLPEEKARGITIDLGFAPLDLPDGRRVGIVDVPGHEGLVRTMVSGASGIDGVLLVVAADEGVMPQTREHLAICSLLDVRSGVVALTRSDLVDDEMIELAAAEVEDLIATTSLAGAAIIPISSVTGAGLDALRDALVAVCDSTAPRTARTGPPRLWVDRAFTMRGFGSVVTGTLVGSSLAVGDEVELLPDGHRSRVRGLQVHGEDTTRAEPGARCAINLQTLERDKLARGQLLTRPGALPTTSTADVRIDWLAGAPEQTDVTAVELLCGTSERRARLAPIGGEALSPGHSSLARLHVDGPAISVLPGERFIVRGFARNADTGHTLGGGQWLDVAPPRRRRSDPALVSDLERLAHGDPVDAVDVRIIRSGLSGMSRTRLGFETGLEEAALEQAVDSLVERGRVCRAHGDVLVAHETVVRLAQSLHDTLHAHHEAEPLRPGMSGAALRSTLPENVARETAELALASLEAESRVERRDDIVMIAGHVPRLDDRLQDLVERIVRDVRAAGLEAPSPRDHAQSLGIDAKEYRDLVAHLERQGQLVRAPGDIWFDAEAIAELRAQILAHFESQDELDTQTYKSLIGTTRRTAMPLMELFDELQITRRRGDVRVLRSAG